MKRQSTAKKDLLTPERRQRILEHLRRDGRVFIAQLSGALTVSPDTVRRDLQELADAGLLQRVHGGALPRPPVGATAPYVTRERRETAGAARNAIAEAAARLVHPGQVVFLDGGTTALEVARRLPADLRATVVTHSPPVALALAEHRDIEVIVAGGRLFREAMVNGGETAVETLRGIRADVCFLGVCGVHPEVGLTTTHYEEVALKRTIVTQAGDVVALAAAEKLHTALPYVVGPLNLLTHLVTDRAAPENVLEVYRQLGLTVISA